MITALANWQQAFSLNSLAFVNDGKLLSLTLRKQICAVPFLKNKLSKAFIELYYNTRGSHSPIGNLSPVEYERQRAH